MFVVYFYEDKNVLLVQLLKRYPSTGEDLKIKGRKGKVVSVNEDGKNIHVQVVLEKVDKSKKIIDPKKKKRR